ncbi:MAG TPA: STAS domain-containing protein [Bacteroidales bacterium]|nr:STAS domain-containing protein [Bacteroidales bacterium]
MDLKESKQGNFLIINLTGRLDTSNYGDLEKKLLGFIEKGEKDIVVNCSDLVYISSSGLRVLLMALKKVTAAGGKFYLCCLQNNIREIFEIAGFTSIFSLFDTLEESIK